MYRLRKAFVVLVSVLLVFSSMNFPVLAVDGESPPNDMISIPPTSKWSGAVMGDVGGQDNITADNFRIVEHEDGTVQMEVLNNRGKIASSTEGIAYYFQKIAPEDNFELSATVQVKSFDANNQVGFGLMLRSNILENTYDGSFTGDYVALGAIRQSMRGFYKEFDSNYKYPDDLLFSSSLPKEADTFDLKLRKDGSVYQLTIDGDTKVLEDYNKDLHYAGLFVSRNAEVIFSNVQLKIDGQVDLGDWEFRAFGSNTSESRNPEPTINEDGSVTLTAKGGKIASGDEGISYYFKELPTDLNFKILAEAKVESFNKDSSIGSVNQKSFGLMIRDSVGEHGDSDKQTSNYVAVGALDTVMKGFYKNESGQTKLAAFEDVNNPTANEVYQLEINKSGDVYQLIVNGQTEVIEVEDLFTAPFYAGVYVARDAEVTFRNIEIIPEMRTVTELIVDSSQMKKEYLVGEELDLTGLVVTAKYSDGTEEVLTESEYIVTGFDSSEPGAITIKINYGGKSAQIELTILSLTITNVTIKYYPAKTEYYIGDTFNPQGLVVLAEYNDGYLAGELSEEEYEIYINDTLYQNYIFDKHGTHTVVIQPIDSEKTAEFDVFVREAALKELKIKREPEKLQYFLGDEELDLAGLLVYAVYDDESEVRLLPNEYEVSGFDSSKAGDQAITITHKGKSAEFTINVKEKEQLGLEITKYPQSTFTVGEEFNHDGLEVAIVYDNGDLETIEESNYIVDDSEYNNSVPGVYDIQVIPTNEIDLDPIIYQVTVREKTEYTFDTIIFGQSIKNNENNRVEVNEDGSVRIVSLNDQGKITGDHDGISFYYTVIDAKEDNFELSADITVNEYAKDPHDGQESFGIMARDAIGENLDSGVFASNIAAVGGYSGGTRNPNGTQLFVRKGVLSSDGEGSQGIQAKMLKQEKPTLNNTHPAKTYHLTLKKTNSGFVGQLHDGENIYEDIIYEPDILNVQDDKAYIGFYAARVADIEVSNIELKVTAAETDAPRVEPPAQPVEPEFQVLSLDRTSNTNYDLIVESNVDGSLTIKQGNEVIYSDVPVKAGETLTRQTEIPKNTSTNFSFIFLPDDTQYLTHYEPMVQNFTVENRVFEQDEIYVSTEGRPVGDGTKENPVDLDTAIDFVSPGQYIYLMQGTYYRDTTLEIKKYNDGTKENMKYLWADPEAEERPVIDFDKKGQGVIHSGDYWYVKGIDFRRSAPNYKGYTVGGSHNIIDNVRTYENGDTGLQISRTDNANDIKEWPSYNTIMNSVSFDNRDPSDNNADGFAAKLTSGYGNKFVNTIAHNNIDDGWDLYTKVGSGAIGPVTIENSIAFNNGFLTDGTVGNGDKNGFKLGGEGVHVPHIIKNSIAFGNGAYGFTSNSNPGVIAIDNIAFNNDGGNLNFTTYGGIKTDFTIDGFISFFTNEEIVEVFSYLANNVTEESESKNKKPEDNYPEENKSEVNFLFDGSKSVNSLGHELPNEMIEELSKISEVAIYENGEIDLDAVWVSLEQTFEELGEFLGEYREEPEDPEEPTPGDPEDPNPEEPEDPAPGDPEDPTPEDPSEENGDGDQDNGPSGNDENQPGEDEQGTDDQVDGDKDNDGEIDKNQEKEKQDKDSDESVDKEKQEKVLPNTANQTGNVLMLGLLLLALSLTVIVVRRRLVNKDV